jgi:DNA repair protein RecO (recombination protein O)
MLAKGARKARGKQPAKRTLLQPFQPLQLSYGGRGEMRLLNHLEAAGVPLQLQGKALYSGIYINELVLRLLPISDPYPALFAYYQTALNKLQNSVDVEPALRHFESHMLAELGYHVDLTCDMVTKAAVQAQAHYQFTPLQGVCELATPPAAGEISIPGSILLELQTEDELSEQARKVSKYIARANLDSLLGERPLRSRELFQQLRRPQQHK